MYKGAGSAEVNMFMQPGVIGGFAAGPKSNILLLKSSSAPQGLVRVAFSQSIAHGAHEAQDGLNLGREEVA